MINGIKGGLVLGNSHSLGGVKLFRKEGIPYFKNEFARFFGYQADVQGGEYLINHIAVDKYSKRIEQINNSVQDNYKTFLKILKTARYVLDCTETNKLIIGFESMFVVNCQATIENIEELDYINDFGQEKLI